VAVTWLPLVVLGVWTGRPNALVYQPAVHVRLLLAAPVFLILHQLFPAICQYTLGQLNQQSFVPAQAQQQVDGLLRSAARLADSPIHQQALWVIRPPRSGHRGSARVRRIAGDDCIRLMFSLDRVSDSQDSRGVALSNLASQ
jgi:hypothetical protein